MSQHGHGILMLNDYCFLEIFKHLSVVDLANFKENFASLGAVVDMEFVRKTHGSFFFGCRDRMGNALRIIRQFGASIKDLTIDYHGWYETEWSEIFTIISEHCSEQLKALALCGDAVGLIKESDISLIADVLKNVETLELKDLNHEARWNYSQDFVNILSRCENAKLIALISYIDLDGHATMFQANKNLSKLKLRRLNNLAAIVDSLLSTRLEDFTVICSATEDQQPNSCYETMSQLFRLNHLQRLCIDCWNMDISRFLQNEDTATSLNVLSLSNAHLDDTNIATLGRIARLKVLKLQDSCCHTIEMRFNSVLILCGNRTIEHLILLCYHEPIDGTGFLKLIEKRKASAAEKCLHFTVTTNLFGQMVGGIPAELIEANKETLKLLDEDDRNCEYYNLDRDESL